MDDNQLSDDRMPPADDPMLQPASNPSQLTNDDNGLPPVTPPLPEDGPPPAAPPPAGPGTPAISYQHPATDSDLDEHELYDEGLAGAAGLDDTPAATPAPDDQNSPPATTPNVT